jgi:hypothetical protein
MRHPCTRFDSNYRKVSLKNLFRYFLELVRNAGLTKIKSIFFNRIYFQASKDQFPNVTVFLHFLLGGLALLFEVDLECSP